MWLRCLETGCLESVGCATEKDTKAQFEVVKP